MITFAQLNIGDPIHVLEITGTFKKVLLTIKVL